MNVSFVDYQKQHKKYGKEIDSAIKRICNSRARILQGEVKKFEEGLAEFVGTKYAVGLNSGTDALFLGLKLLGIGKGDEVITTGHTFHATVEAIHWNGAKPVLADVGADGMIDVESVRKKITKRTKAVLPVHLMGDMADCKALNKLCKDNGLLLVEDACQALGSERGGKMAGAWGVFGAFSFFPAKILGAYGDAGALTTNDYYLAKELKDMREHYKYNPGKWGFNSRLDELQAAILNVKLAHLNEIIGRRKEIADIYDANLDGPVLPTKRDGRVYQDYIIRVPDAADLYNYLKTKGVETMRNNYHFPDDCPKPKATVELEETTLRIPCNDVLTNKEVAYVCEQINAYFR